MRLNLIEEFFTIETLSLKENRRILSFLGQIPPSCVLIVLCLSLYLPGLFVIPPIDRDEARYAQASRQMLEDHDYVRIRFQDQPRHKKPAGIYWLQAASVAASGMLGSKEIWPYRIPSLLGAIAAVLLVFGFGKRLFNVKTAYLGAALTACSVLLIIEAHQATTDAALLAAALAAQGSLGLVYVETRKGQDVSPWISFSFWIAQGIGILLKGPVIPFISVLTICSLLIADRKGRWLSKLQPLPGIVLTTLIVSPWMISINIATGGAFFSDSIRSDLLPKLISGHESHGFPPGYYALLLMVTFWPGSFFVLPAMQRAWKCRGQESTRFCLAVIIPTWLAFELIPTKLPHYILPVYPFLALLTADAILDVATGAIHLVRSKLARTGFIVWCLIAIILSAGIAIIPYALEDRFYSLAFWPAGIALLLLVYFWRKISRYLLLEISITAIIGAILIFGPTFQIIFPRTNSLWLSREAAKAVAQLSSEYQGASPLLLAAGYHEPSLVFHCGTGTKLVSPSQAAVFFHIYPKSIAIVGNDGEKEFFQWLEMLDQPAYLRNVVRGFNYTKGRWVTLKLYTAKL